jgi:membrane fusion protein (multidrug efflux system)
VEIGNHIQLGQALFAIVDPSAWILANFKETQVGKLPVGQPVEIRLNAIPDHTLTGHIESFAPASGAQFPLLPTGQRDGELDQSCATRAGKNRV